MSLPQWVEIAAILLWLAAILLLYYGNLGIPWEMQTWSGASEGEVRWDRRRRAMKWVGIPCAIVAAILQIILTVFPTTP